MLHKFSLKNHTSGFGNILSWSHLKPMIYIFMTITGPKVLASGKPF